MPPLLTLFAVAVLGAMILLVITWALRRAYRHGTGIKSAATISALAFALFVVLKHAS